MRCGVLLLASAAAYAASIPMVGFDELVSRADAIVSGAVVSKSVDWDSGHHLIWTKYKIEIRDVIKGRATATVTVAEPGGALDGKELQVPGAVVYSVGERVTLFLRRFPDGDCRTIGWSQGKFLRGKDGLMHGAGTAAHLEGLAPDVFRANVRSAMDRLGVAR